MERRKFLKGAALSAGTAALAAPAVAQGMKTMAIVSSWPRDLPGPGTSAQRLAARITELSEGMITTEYFASGERVRGFDAFDEVASGQAESYIAVEDYWVGKHPAFAYFAGVPFGMTTPEWNAWIHFRGGQDQWDAVGGEFGLKGLPCGGFGTQTGGWFNKEINSIADLQGLKMRTGGFGGQIMSKVGVSAVSLPGGQIYENLVSGAIDATEWVGPFADYFMKFYEAAQFYYSPGMHAPGGAVALGMNAEWWGGLSDWERSVISAACEEENALKTYEESAKNGEYLQRLINDHGVQLRSFPDELWTAFGEAAEELYEEVRDHSELARTVTDAYWESLREIGGYRKLAEVEFSQQRNRVFGI